jgi:predicted alpha/beta-fold hydrolase
MAETVINSPAGSQFSPPFYIRNAYVQTILGSRRLHRRNANPVVATACPVRIPTPSGAILGGAYSPHPSGYPKGLVILIHGWEGSMDSTYVLTTSQYLFRKGFAVFRLNLRDHGDTHALNEGLFFATLLEEVHEAVLQIAQLLTGVPVFLVGFSLGGNFALRIARKCLQRPIPALRHIFSISPALDPGKATDCIDTNPFILSYFLNKWRRSLSRKQTLFPEQYQLDDLLSISSLREMTAALLTRYSHYQDPNIYFANYTLTGDALCNIVIPTTILTAADDPIIPAADFRDLKLNNITECIILEHGGHNGFLKGLFTGCWYETKMAICFNDHCMR